MSLNKKKNWDINSLAEYISTIVAEESGNVLGEKQKSMVVSRLKKRLIDLGNLDPNTYYNYLVNNYNKESSHLISALTTHHTFFFREFSHFEFLLNNLDEIVENVRKRAGGKIKILSAACSKGHEVYSLATFFSYHLKKYPDVDFEVVGTDIDPKCVEYAKNGVYSYTEVKSIPNIYLNGNWKRGTGDISRFAKVKDHIKSKCRFATMNLLNIKDTLSKDKFDIIFCRNVFIYFDFSDVEKIVEEFKNHLFEDGLFITGLSESLKLMKSHKNSLAPSVYSFSEPKLSIVSEEVKPSVKKITKSTPVIPKPIKMLIVDDSSSVVKLLTKIFSADESFEVVGTAGNGLEANEFLKNNKVDALTLDIHMPEMDGVEYLKKNYHSKHPKVVVVSSASREDARYAQEALKSGAADFVEKPALNNLSERAEEIKNKIKMSFLNATSAETKIDQSFKKDFKIDSPESKGRAIVCNYSDLSKVKKLIESLKEDQPPLFLFFEGNKNFLEVIKEDLAKDNKVELFSENTIFSKNTIYLCDFKSDFPNLDKFVPLENVSLSVFGIVSEALEKRIIEYNIGQVLLEDNEHINEGLREIVSDLFPWTSFEHIATEFLAK